jgi:hypothetical protein
VSADGWGFSFLGRLANSAKYLAGGGLVEAYGGVDLADSLKQACDTQGCHFASEDRLALGGRHKALSRRAANLQGLVLVQDAGKRRLVEKVTSYESEAILNVADALRSHGSGAMDEPDKLVALLQ